MTARCAEVRLALGVYVIGVIDPGERALVDQHLAACPKCRAELAGLAGLPAWLGSLTLDEAEAAEPRRGPRRPLS